MKPSTEQVQVVQVLYEIAMSIGTSLDLRPMLKTSLSTFLKKLNCLAGGIHLLTENGDNTFRFVEDYAIPGNADQNNTYLAALQHLPELLTREGMSQFEKTLPVSGQDNLQNHYHILSLSNVGVMVLVTNGQALDPPIIKSLNPLLLKLAQACNACKTKQALQLSRERFQHVITSISPHIYVTELTPEGEQKNVYISPNVTELTGYPLERFTEDWSFWPSTVIHPQDRAKAAAQVAQFARGQDSELEYRLVRANGKIIWIRDSGRVEQIHGSRSILVYGAVNDITQRKKAEAALGVAHKEAVEAGRLKSELLANVSHDLRTPINAILGYAEMLQEGIYGPLSDHQRTATAEIINSTGQLLDFVNNLLGQAQIESGRATLNITSFSPADLFDASHASLDALARSKGLTLTTDIAPNLPKTLFGDPYWLRQILVNLVGNALKFTTEGTVGVKIYQPDPDTWALEVSDTGAGITEEAQAYIFDAFTHGKELTTHPHMSSGLGLSIVKQITEMMDGYVNLTSMAGRGSTFAIVLPLQTTPEKPIGT